MSLQRAWPCTHALLLRVAMRPRPTLALKTEEELRIAELEHGQLQAPIASGADDNTGRSQAPPPEADRAPAYPPGTDHMFEGVAPTRPPSDLIGAMSRRLRRVRRSRLA